jgi:hypothetical protein
MAVEVKLQQVKEYSVENIHPLGLSVVPVSVFTSTCRDCR